MCETWFASAVSYLTRIRKLSDPHAEAADPAMLFIGPADVPGAWGFLGGGGGIEKGTQCWYGIPLGTRANIAP